MLKIIKSKGLINMKKVLYLLMSFVVIMSCALSVLAAPSNTIELSATNITAKAGTVVKVPVSVKNISDGIYCAQLKYQFDASKLKVKSVVRGELINSKQDYFLASNSKQDWVMAIIEATDYDDAIVNNGIVMYIEFEVLQDVTNLKLACDGANTAFFGTNYKEINYVSQNVELNTKMEVQVGSITGKAGTVVTVPVSVNNVNTGIYCAQLKYKFDASKLKVKSIVRGELINSKQDYFLTSNSKQDWVMAVIEARDYDDAIVKNGTIMYLEFELLQDVTGMKITCDGANTAFFGTNYKEINYVDSASK